MRTFQIKVHYKVVKILEVRWLDYYKRRKLAGLSPGNDEVSIICLPNKLIIVLVHGLVRSENEARILYTVEKGLFCSLKVHTLKKFAAKLLSIFLAVIQAGQHGLYT